MKPGRCGRLHPLLFLALVGCGGDGPLRPDPLPVLSLTGSAEGEVGGERVACTLSATIEVASADARGWTGTVVFGEVQRTVTRGGEGSGFSAVVGGPASLAEGPGGRVTLEWVGEQPDDAAPLWRALAAMSGSRRSAFRYEGGWSCAPTGVVSASFVDTLVVADGDWALAPR